MSRQRQQFRKLVSAWVVLLSAAVVKAATINVPGDQPTIQAGLDAAGPGDTVLVAGGVYNERVSFPSSGTVGSPIVLRAATDPNGPTPAVIEGGGLAGDSIVLIDSKSYVRIEGFEIRNTGSMQEVSGIRVRGSGTGIEIVGNVIHEIRGQNAMGITVYGTQSTPISNLLIEANEIFDCEPKPSEALVLNGNVRDFIVRGNYIHDVNNIGMDFIGGETDIQPDPSLVARQGVVQDNRIERAQEGGPTGDGFAACIYVDGGRDIVIERNYATDCDMGVEVGAENKGLVASGVVVRDNFLWANRKACIVFGGFSSSVGRANGNSFLNNTCWGNDTTQSGFGELWIQYAQDNVVRNNVFVANSQNLLLSSWDGNVNNVLDYNVWWAPAGAGGGVFIWNGTSYGGFAAYRAGTGQDASSLFADPLLVDPAAGDLHLGPGSPALDAGDPAFVPGAGETDIDGQMRVNGVRVDAGADEAATCGDGNVDTAYGEQCDDGNTVDCDGCDSNCTLSSVCGNGIVCPSEGEACDDGNAVGGDCCDANCAFEPAGAPCDDGSACTRDTCDGAGTCVGSAAPATGCRRPVVAGRARLIIRDAARDRSDKLLFKWKKGAATSAADFGDPVSGGTDYELCIYDLAGPALLFAARAPAGGICGGHPCWKAATGGGFRYKDRYRTPDGLDRLVLRPGEAGKARIVVKGKGELLTLPALPLAPGYSIAAQLHNSAGTCWEATFSDPARRNDAAKFVDDDG